MKFNNPFGKEIKPANPTLKVFSIRDSKIEAFMRPFFAQTTQEAMRIWEDSVNGDTGFARHPDDYMLFEVGTFDLTTGQLDSLLQPKSLGLASDFIRQVPNLSQPSLPGINPN